MACDENPCYVPKQQWKAAWMGTPGTQWHIPGRAGEIRSPYQGKLMPVSGRKINSMIYYPVAVQCYWHAVQKHATANPAKTEGLVIKGKSNHPFWALVLQQVRSCLFSFQQQGLGTVPGEPSQPGSDTCPAQELSPCQDWLPWKACKASLAFGAQSSGYRSTSIHLFYVFSLPGIGGMQGKCSGGNKYGVMLSYLARNCSYTYFHSISGGVINNHYLLWPILPFLFFSINVSSLRE